MRKTRRQKYGCSFQRVSFIRTWITLHSCTLDLMYASVHHRLYKKRNLLFIAKYSLFYDFSKKYLCKTWWYHESFRNPMEYFCKIHHSINDNNVLFTKNWCQDHYWCQDHNWLNRVIDWGGEWFQKFFQNIIESHHFEQKQ